MMTKLKLLLHVFCLWQHSIAYRLCWHKSPQQPNCYLRQTINNDAFKTLLPKAKGVDIITQVVGQPRVWRGKRHLLPFLGQLPDPAYTPQRVVQICLGALQRNDDPQLDHGCCVLLEFMSPDGAIAACGLDPRGYGAYVRNSEDFSVLLDNRQTALCETPTSLVAGAICSVESLGREVHQQRVRVLPWESPADSPPADWAHFVFGMSRHNGTWLVDDISLT